MNREVGTKWVEALRSGKFAQGKSRLNSEGNLCCLGVLCELAVEAGVVEKIGSSTVRYGGLVCTLPPEVATWAELHGIGNDAGTLPRPLSSADQTEEAKSLVCLNDGWDYNFEQIAQVIEDQMDDL